MTAKQKSPADAPPSANDEQVSASPPSKSRGRLIFAAGFAGLWVLGLIVLAMLTANPVTLNRQQILGSDYVATAVRKDADSPVLEVQKEWKHGEKLGEITITNLSDIDMPAGREFLVPLEQMGRNRFLVTPTALPNKAPLIYPATPESKAQLKDILGQRETAE